MDKIQVNLLDTELLFKIMLHRKGFTQGFNSEKTYIPKGRLDRHANLAEPELGRYEEVLALESFLTNSLTNILLGLINYRRRS